MTLKTLIALLALFAASTCEAQVQSVTVVGECSPGMPPSGCDNLCVAIPMVWSDVPIGSGFRMFSIELGERTGFAANVLTVPIFSASVVQNPALIWLGPAQSNYYWWLSGSSFFGNASSSYLLQSTCIPTFVHQTQMFVTYDGAAVVPGATIFFQAIYVHVNSVGGAIDMGASDAYAVTW